MAKEARLLRTQKNELVPLVQNVGFEMDEFRWDHDDSFQEKRPSGYRMGQRTTVTETLVISVLVHKRSGYYCKFGPHRMVISPGASELIENVYPKTREVGFQEWLTNLKREVGSPDLWNELGKGAIERLSEAERAPSLLRKAGKHTAASELREATADLSNTPPDLTGAVQTFPCRSGMCR